MARWRNLWESMGDTVDVTGSESGDREGGIAINKDAQERDNRLAEIRLRRLLGWLDYCDELSDGWRWPTGAQFGYRSIATPSIVW